jgi:adenylate cyclase
MPEMNPVASQVGDIVFVLPRRAAWGLSPLPSRAQRIVDAGLHDAEWRITLVQALIVTFLGVLFFTSPSPVAPVSDLRPVPYALAAMCLALAIRVAVLAILPRVSRIWAYSSVVMDVSVIIALIWSFHLQYGESLALFLKAPTQLYLFVVIAWHGLTLDPLRVAFAGIMAAAGWLLLMLASIYQGGEEIITRDFMTYMMSSRVLIGAEIDRIIAILLFTAVLCVGLVSARSQMLMAALGVSATSELARFFAAGLADRIAVADERAEAGEAVRTQATVMMVDIRDFTNLASRNTPEETLSILTGIQSRAVAAISRHGGAIDKFLGDGILATFGCVSPLPKPASSAIRAARDLMDEIARWDIERLAADHSPVRIGIAISSGEVLFGTVGFGDRLEFTVIGDTVNRAAKLEKYNKVIGSSVIIDGATDILARREGLRSGPVRRIEDCQVPGVAHPLSIVVVA